MVSADCKLSTRGTKISVMILGVTIITILLTYLAFGETYDDQGLNSLRMISVLFRHGEKNPTSFYPNDPHSERDWLGGLGALTQKGSLQAYSLGKNLRKRYYRLLPQDGLYSQQNMYVLSSAAERCLMSAQSVLAGLMPPLKHNNALPMLWQPIPVHSVPRMEDTLLAQKKPCLKYDKILNDLYTAPPIDLQRINQENGDLYRILSKRMGKNVTNVLDVEILYNLLTIEKETDLTLPKWANNLYPEALRPLAEKSYTLFTETQLMKKIKGGAFLSEVHNAMISKYNKNKKMDRKVYLYSGHDVTMVNVMNSLNILDQTDRLPQYSSALVFELHYSSLFKDDFEVKIVYFYNSEDKFPKVIAIPNCSAPCSLAEFTKSLSTLLLNDYDEACENPSIDCKA